MLRPQVWSLVFAALMFSACAEGVQKDAKDDDAAPVDDHEGTGGSTGPVTSSGVGANTTTAGSGVGGAGIGGAGIGGAGIGGAGIGGAGVGGAGVGGAGVGGAGVGGAGVGGAGPTCSLDIEQVLTDDFTLFPPWQSFTPQLGGVLERIELRPNAFGGISGVLSIYEGTGVSGLLLHSQPYALPSAAGSPWENFVLTGGGLPVIAGETYTWELTGAGGIRYSSLNPYPGGSMSVPALDMAFRTFVCP